MDAIYEKAALKGLEDKRLHYKRIIIETIAIFMALQTLGNLDVLMTALSAERGPGSLIPVNLEKLSSWKFGAGIDNQDATTAVMGLAALIITINVAVFAARLGGPPSDLRAELEIARWQSTLEELAPYAAGAAAAITATRIPKDPGLLCILMVASVIAVGASDVKIASRLSVLEATEFSARVPYKHAQDKLRNLKQALPDRALAELPKPLKNSARYTVHAYLPTLYIAVLVTVIQAGLDLYFRVSGASESAPATALGYGFMFLVNAALLSIVQSILGLLLNIPVRKASKTGKKLRGIGGPSLWLMTLFSVSPALLIIPSLETSPLSAVVVGAPLLLGGLLQLLVIHVAFAAGRGPGLVNLHVAVAQLEEKEKAARTHLEAVLQDHDFEKEFHRTLGAHRRSSGIARVLRKVASDALHHDSL